jgi:cellulose synthase/poly-beta-1,6-N-acetylglucosamine synthase-like glycosyltransferase
MLLSHVFFWTSWALVVYAYVIFPIILAAVARRVGKTSVRTARLEAPEEAPLLRVAMVVAAYNEAAVLSEKLANTWRIDYPADRFSLIIGSEIIGSDGSSDATQTVLETCNNPRRDPSGAALPRWSGFFRFIFKTQRVTWERASR